MAEFEVSTSTTSLLERWTNGEDLLDAWVDPRRMWRIEIRRLVAPLSDEGYVIVARDGSRVLKVVVMLVGEEGLESVPSGEEARVLARQRTATRKRKGRASPLAIAGLALALGLSLGACGLSSVDERAEDEATYGSSTPSASAPKDEASTPASEDETRTDEPGYRSHSECDLLEIDTLPSGEPAGEAVQREPRLVSEARYSWGDGTDSVGANWGVEHLDGTARDDWLPDDFPESQTVSVGGVRRLILPVGDPPASQIQIRFVVDECPYTVWVGPGLTVEEAKEYARGL